MFSISPRYLTFLSERIYLFSITIVVLACIAAEQIMERQFLAHYEDEQQLLSLEQLATLRHRLESLVNNNLSLINGLSAFIQVNPDLTSEEFDRYASAVLSRETMLVNLAAAPDFVIEYIYPLEGNEEAIGLNYLANENQRDAVVRTVESREMTIAGPLELVQGGRAIIGRSPVVIEDGADGQSWGVVSAPMLMETLYEQSGIHELNGSLEVAIRGTDSLGEAGAVFYGDASLFDHPNAAIFPVSIGTSGEWLIAGRPVTEDGFKGMILIAIRAGSLITAFSLLLIILVSRSKQIMDSKYRKAMGENLRFLEQVESVSKVGGWRFDRKARFTELSDQAREIIGLPTKVRKVDLATFCACFTDSSAEKLKKPFENYLNQHLGFDEEIRVTRLDGCQLWLHLEGSEIHEADNDPLLIGTIQDITREKEYAQTIEYQANFDVLTDLPNRIMFISKVKEALEATTEHSRLAVIFIDLDDFKSINDNLGHKIGDRVLIEASKRIGSHFKANDILARYSGDEFTVLVEDSDTYESLTSILDSIIDSMNRPFLFAESQVFSGVSIGVSVFPEDGSDPEALIIKADQAMYQVKKAGKRNWQFYSNDIQKESEFKHTLYNNLLSAMNRNQLEVRYQPIISGETGEVVSCEALARWRDDKGNWVSTEVFIGVAEERGIVNRIDYIILQKASEQLQSLNAAMNSSIGLSINVSPRLLKLTDEYGRKWLDHLNHICKKIDVSVEITERLLIESTEQVTALLNDLSWKGVTFAIDDFGIGYSGLSYFSRFPVSTMKIDKSFIHKMLESRTELSLVESMLILGKKLNIKVVAEGVENSSQRDFLREHHCDMLQGYYISPPLTFEELCEYMKTLKPS